MFRTDRPKDQLAEVLAIPGVGWVPGCVFAAYDVAWRVGELLHFAVPEPSQEVLAPGMEQYVALGFREKLRGYQKEAVMFLLRRAWALLSLPMQCVDGSTLLNVARSGAVRSLSIEHVVKKMQGSCPRPWRQNIPSFVMAQGPSGLERAQITAVHVAGVKPAWCVETDERSLVCSAEHEFSTPQGYTALRDLRVGDSVHAMSRREPTNDRSTVTGGMWSHPYAHPYEYAHRGRQEYVAHVATHRLAAEAALNDLSFEAYVARLRIGDLRGLQFLSPNQWHVRHRNGNVHDNSPSNLEVIRPEDRLRTQTLLRWAITTTRINRIVEVVARPMFDLTTSLGNYCANGLVVHNSGKTVTTLAADIALGSQHTLIVAPGIAKWVWADEIQKWTGERAMILEGRGGDSARYYCVACSGTGRMEKGAAMTEAPIATGIEDHDGPPPAAGPSDAGPSDAFGVCGACRQLNGQAYGYDLYEVRQVARPLSLDADVAVRRRERVRTTTGVNLLRLPVWGPRLPRREEVLFGPRQYQCSIHQDVVSTDPTRYCKACRARLLEALRAARYIIVNPDILIAQEAHDQAGGLLGMRPDLPGWSPTLSNLDFDVAVLDEVHLYRGRPEKEKRRTHRRSRLLDVLRRVGRVWGLTGTPVYGFTRDLWGPLDILSDGLYGRPWRGFDEAYCEGHYDSQGGWIAKGRSIRAETELKRRLLFSMHKRERREIRPELPLKQRQTIRVESTKVYGFDGHGPRHEAIGRALGSSLDDKLEVVVDNIVGQIGEGNCVIAFCYLRASCERVYTALNAAMVKSAVAPRIRAVNATSWLGHGGVSDKGRFDLAAKFRLHAEMGFGGVLVTTIDAMQVAVSLRGATFVHFVELHHDPGALAQAEDRPSAGSGGVTVIYYVVRNSPDEDVLAVVLPKMETQERLTDDETAASSRAALIERETSEAIWDRLTRHLSAKHEGPPSPPSPPGPAKG